MKTLHFPIPISLEVYHLSRKAKTALNSMQIVWVRKLDERNGELEMSFVERHTKIALDGNQLKWFIPKRLSLAFGQPNIFSNLSFLSQFSENSIAQTSKALENSVCSKFYYFVSFVCSMLIARNAFTKWIYIFIWPWYCCATTHTIDLLVLWCDARLLAVCDARLSVALIVCCFSASFRSASHLDVVFFVNQSNLLFTLNSERMKWNKR